MACATASRRPCAAARPATWPPGCPPPACSAPRRCRSWPGWSWNTGRVPEQAADPSSARLLAAEREGRGAGGGATAADASTPPPGPSTADEGTQPQSRPSAAALASAPVYLAGYELLGELGRGGMGAVL